MSSVLAAPTERPESVTIVGSGIAGLVVAAGLHPAARITVYEAADWIGGHAHTVDVDDGGRRLAIDTGFIVANDWTYPRFLALLARLGVATQPAAMSFSLQHEVSGLEYAGTDALALFAQRRNLVSPSFWRMLIDIVRFNRDARRALEGAVEEDVTLGEWLAARGYGPALAEHYLVPMGRAIWSAGAAALLGFPARFFIEFFLRHGLLSINDRPEWRAVVGGSREYVKALAAPFRAHIRLATPVLAVERRPGEVQVTTRHGVEHHDAIVFACHADTALALLGDPSRAEREILGSFPFQANEAVLHTDERLLPRARAARAAWNYHLRRDPGARCAVTYDMNVLQSLATARRYLVSLNLGDRIDPGAVLARFDYDHPVYSPAVVRAQRRHGEISGVRRSFYAGAYWRHGFHEDGVVSAETVLGQFAAWREGHAERALSRLG